MLVLLRPASSDLCLSEQWVNNQPLSQPPSQAAFPSSTIVLMLLTRTEVFWEQLELLLAEKKRVSPYCISLLQVYTFIYLHVLHYSWDWRWTKNEQGLFHTSQECSTIQSRLLCFVWTNVSCCPGNFLTQMEMDLSKLTHNVPFCYFQNYTSKDNLFPKVRKYKLFNSPTPASIVLIISPLNFSLSKNTQKKRINVRLSRCFHNHYFIRKVTRQ